MCRWIEGNGSDVNQDEMIEIEVEHCNKALNEKNKFLVGCFKDDGFYLGDGGELSYNWDIIRWKYI